MNEREIDQHLVRCAQQGDDRAFAMLITKYKTKSMRLVARFINDRGAVEDIIQEASLRAHRALPTFRGESAFYTWLYRIIINTAKNYLASQRRYTNIVMDPFDSLSTYETPRDMETPECLLRGKQIAETISQLMQSLPEELRGAIVLREIDGLSYDEIATTMCCPVGTVRSRIFRAREVIASQLRPFLEVT